MEFYRVGKRPTLFFTDLTIEGFVFSAQCCDMILINYLLLICFQKIGMNWVALLLSQYRAGTQMVPEFVRI